MTRKMKCLVIGVGNTFRSDDAVGVVVAAELRKHKLPPHIEIIEGGTDEFGLIEHFKTARHVVIIDAVSMGKPPGTVSVFTTDEVNLASTAENAYLHGFSLVDMIALVKALGISPKITVVGIEPQSTKLGENLTPLVASRVPLLVQILLNKVLPGICGVFKSITRTHVCTDWYGPS